MSHYFITIIGILFSWFSDVLAIGSIRQLELNDLPYLPITCKSINCTRDFQLAAASNSNDDRDDINNDNNDINDGDDDEFSKNLKKKIISDKNDQKLNINNFKKENWLIKNNNNKKSIGFNSLLNLIFKVHGWTFFILGFLKLTMCCASFLGPVLLGKMVAYIEEDDSNIETGLLLVTSLGFSFILSAMLNTLFNIRACVMQIKLKSALTRILFSRTVRLPLYAYSDLNLTDSQLINLVQVDTEKVADVIKSLHDLWSLPLQIIIAFVLLYLQVRIAFVAGVAIIILMIPINTIIANKIGVVTKSLLLQKDKRIQILSEAIRNMKSVKMMSYERVVYILSGGYRTNEVKSLSTRKYLDALCVFLWATTPVLVPFATFSTVVLVRIVIIFYLIKLYSLCLFKLLLYVI
jgi:ABC-type bacteriocin/lantibiotic exporter with double-glycine peptidase domain